ncbi:MAG TPA: glycogen synthase GlgA [Abditibacteriaceae bacterium]|nr:glycogen synthase GlgA [Abditibacteriaceae bacterium]
MARPLQVLMVASEAVPYVKTGGLADVIGSLPHALVAQGIDVRVVLPHYAGIDNRDFNPHVLGTIHATVDGVSQAAKIRQTTSPASPGTAAQSTAVQSTAVPVYLIDAPHYFHRPQPYGYEDDVLRFGFFSRACLEMWPVLDWQPDIIHCHDWHTGLVPVFLSTGDFGDRLTGIKTIFSIHNLVYQGLSDASYLPRLGLDATLFNHHQLEFYGRLNLLKAGLVFADVLTTVSPNYAREIQTPEFGAGLEGVLQERAGVLHGILNGIDYGVWHPCHDGYLPQRFGPDDLSGKSVCKRSLLRRMGLSEKDWETRPVIGMVSRLSAQKGFDLVEGALSHLIALGCHVVLLGSGDASYMQLFQGLNARCAGAFRAELGRYDEELAHQIYAGSDMFLMPSHYEPCGLSQMISLAYGTIPIVRATGGLADSVMEFGPATGCGNGFVFHDYSVPALLEAMKRALHCYRSDDWPRVMQNAFTCDFSWDASACAYAQLYRDIVK